MYKLFLTRRYVFKPLSLVTIAALALSVVIFTAAPSVMNGFQEDFHEHIRSTMSDMSLRSEQLLDLPLSEPIESAIEGVPGVKAVAPFIDHPAIYRNLSKADYCLMRGVVPGREEQVTDLRSFVLSERDWFYENEDYSSRPPADRKAIEEMGKPLTPSVPVAKKELAAAAAALEAGKKANKNAAEIAALDADVQHAEKQLKKAEAHVDEIYRKLEEGVDDPLEPGKKIPAVLAGIFFMNVYRLDIDSVVKLTTAAGEGGEVQQDKRFAVVGAFRAGTHDVDRRTLYMSLSAAQGFIGTKKVSGYAIKLKDYNEVKAVRDGLRKSLKPFVESGEISKHSSLRSWEEMNENLLKAVGMERLLIKLITGMIVLAASATIFLVLVMSVQFKVRELGILRAVGGSQVGTLQIFLGQGFLLALIGMLVGSAAGLVGAHYINEIASFIHALTGWHPFPPDVYYLERIPSKIYWSELAVNAAITMVLGVFAASPPAFVAAFRPPIRAIRHD